MEERSGSVTEGKKGEAEERRLLMIDRERERESVAVESEKDGKLASRRHEIYSKLERVVL